MKERLDKTLLAGGLVSSRSQAETYIRLGYVTVNKKIITKPGFMVQPSTDNIKVRSKHIYVSRAGNKLASVAKRLHLSFMDKTVLDVGSSTGGFTDYAVRNGAQKVIAVDVGTDQMHPSLRENPRVELHEKTDIRAFKTNKRIDIVLIDVSFISLRNILPAIAHICDSRTEIVAMVKPQFEANGPDKHGGVVKNEKLRRIIMQDFEQWTKQHFVIKDKADSDISGVKGNRERFYLLSKLKV